MAQKVYTRIVLDMTLDDIPVVESDSYEYSGPWSLCEEGGGDSGGGDSGGGDSGGGDSGHDGRSSLGGSRGTDNAPGGLGGDGYGGFDGGGWGGSEVDNASVTDNAINVDASRISEATTGITDLARSYADSINNVPNTLNGIDLSAINRAAAMNNDPYGLGYGATNVDPYGLGLKNEYAQPVNFDSVMGASAEAQNNNQDVGSFTKVRDAVFNNDPRFSAMGMMKSQGDDLFSGIKSGYGYQNGPNGETTNDNVGQALGVAGALIGARGIAAGPQGIPAALKGIGEIANIAGFRAAVDGYTPSKDTESPSRTPGGGYDQGRAYASTERDTESPSAPVQSQTGVSLAMQRKYGQNMGYNVGYPQSFGYNPYMG